MDRKGKDGSRVDKYRSLRKKKRKGFHGYKRINEQECLDDIDEENVEFVSSSSAKDEQLGIKNANTIEKIVPLPATTTLNELSTCSSGYLTRKIKRDCLVTRNIQSSQAHGYKIIEASIIQKLLDVVAVCTSCDGKQNCN